jgi:hypothetical protein
MEVFLAWIRQLLPILGCDILIPVVKSEKLKDSSTALVYPVKGVIAKGQRTPKGFVVFKDSEAAVDLQPATPPKIIKRRQELLEDGNLKRLAEKLGFTKDIEFTSPSAAAAIVCAGKAGGLTAWRNAEGKTLKELESEI